MAEEKQIKQNKAQVPVNAAASALPAKKKRKRKHKKKVTPKDAILPKVKVVAAEKTASTKAVKVANTSIAAEPVKKKRKRRHKKKAVTAKVDADLPQSFVEQNLQNAEPVPDSFAQPEVPAEFAEQPEVVDQPVAEVEPVVEAQPWEAPQPAEADAFAQQPATDAFAQPEVPAEFAEQPEVVDQPVAEVEPVIEAQPWEASQQPADADAFNQQPSTDTFNQPTTDSFAQQPTADAFNQPAPDAFVQPEVPAEFAAQPEVVDQPVAEVEPAIEAQPWEAPEPAEADAFTQQPATDAFNQPAPDSFAQQPVAEAQPWEAPQPAEADAFAQPTPDSFAQQPATDAFDQPEVVDPFAAGFQQSTQETDNEWEQPMQLTGDPMKDIPIFPDNFGEEPSQASEPPQVSQQNDTNDTAANGDFFNTMDYGNATVDAQVNDKEPIASQPIEAEVISSSSEPVYDSSNKTEFALPGEEVKTSGKGFWDILGEAGITKKSVYGACFSLLVLVVIAGFIFGGGWNKISGLFNGFDFWPFSSDNTEQTMNNGDSSNQNGGNNIVSIENANVFGDNAGAKSVSALPLPIRMAQLFGSEFVPLATEYWQKALDNSQALGAPTLKDKLEGDYRIVTAIDLLRRMVNAYGVDINDTLNRSNSRVQALDDYLKLMNDLYNEAKEMRAMIQQEMSVITTSFNLLTDPKKETEVMFFANLDALLANDAAKNLSDFIKYSQEITALKARFKGLERLDAKYLSVLQQYRARIQDLESNRDPLIKGVKVYDVPQSNLNLIIPVELKDLEEIPAA